jgi:hypothetical protein
MLNRPPVNVNSFRLIPDREPRSYCDSRRQLRMIRINATHRQAGQTLPGISFMDLTRSQSALALSAMLA